MKRMRDIAPVVEAAFFITFINAVSRFVIVVARVLNYCSQCVLECVFDMVTTTVN